MWLKRKQMKLTKAQAGVIEWAVAGMQNVVDNPEEAPEFGYTESNLPLLHSGTVLDVSRCNESALADLIYRIEYQMADMASDEGKNATVGMCKRLGIGIRAISGYEGDPLALPVSMYGAPQTVRYDPNTFGVTRPSLSLLRDALVKRADHRLCVLEIPTDDGCCGFAIFDRDTREVVFTGDGFRPDREGEGGAGYNTAGCIFRIFRITPLQVQEPIPLEPIFKGEKTGKEAHDHLLEYFLRVSSGIIVDADFERPIDSVPGYIRLLI